MSFLPRSDFLNGRFQNILNHWLLRLRKFQSMRVPPFSWVVKREWENCENTIVITRIDLRRIKLKIFIIERLLWSWRLQENLCSVQTLCNCGKIIHKETGKPLWGEDSFRRKILSESDRWPVDPARRRVDKFAGDTGERLKAERLWASKTSRSALSNCAKKGYLKVALSAALNGYF